MSGTYFCIIITNLRFPMKKKNKMVTECCHLESSLIRHLQKCNTTFGICQIGYLPIVCTFLQLLLKILTKPKCKSSTIVETMDA